MSDQPDRQHQAHLDHRVQGVLGAAGAAMTRRSFRQQLRALGARACGRRAGRSRYRRALAPGEKMTVEWRGKPVWIVHRTPEQIAELKKNDPLLADPESKRTNFSTTPAYALQNDSAGDQARVPRGDRHLHAPRLLARATSSCPARSRRCPPTGRVASCVPATARPSTSPDVSSRTSRRPTTSRCRRTCTFRTAGSGSAKSKAA